MIDLFLKCAAQVTFSVRAGSLIPLSALPRAPKPVDFISGAENPPFRVCLFCASGCRRPGSFIFLSALYLSFSAGDPVSLFSLSLSATRAPTLCLLLSYFHRFLLVLSLFVFSHLLHLIVLPTVSCLQRPVRGSCCVPLHAHTSVHTMTNVLDVCERPGYFRTISYTAIHPRFKFPTVCMTLHLFLSALQLLSPKFVRASGCLCLSLHAHRSVHITSYFPFLGVRVPPDFQVSISFPGFNCAPILATIAFCPGYTGASCPAPVRPACYRISLICSYLGYTYSSALLLFDSVVGLSCSSLFVSSLSLFAWIYGRC